MKQQSITEHIFTKEILILLDSSYKTELERPDISVVQEIIAAEQQLSKQTQLSVPFLQFLDEFMATVMFILPDGLF